MRILIVEDEEMASRLLKNILIQILGGKIESIQVQRSLTASQCYVQDHTIDLLFLDLNLHGENGFELLASAAAGSFHTIVVSAHTDRAIEAFEYGVLDFVPKPYGEERIRKAFERYHEGLPNSRLKYLSVARDGRISLIPIETINYIEAYDKQAKIYRTSGAIEICNKMLQSLEKILPPDYVRVHRSFIANLREIKELQMMPNRRSCIILNNGDVLPVSRNAYQLVREKIESSSLH
jgi:two-component system, LytTR family, response regulator LytT